MARSLELRAAALHCLLETDPATKAGAVAAMAESYCAGGWEVDTAAVLHGSAAIPGRPVRPALVPPRLVGRRSMVTVEGRAMLIHALAHIEFNAANLALDALWRFRTCRPGTTPTGCVWRKKKQSIFDARRASPGPGSRIRRFSGP
jgi:uncharacterized ferritin-like protein (DUF455 family)